MSQFPLYTQQSAPSPSTRTILIPQLLTRWFMIHSLILRFYDDTTTTTIHRVRNSISNQWCSQFFHHTYQIEFPYFLCTHPRLCQHVMLLLCRFTFLSGGMNVSLSFHLITFLLVSYDMYSSTNVFFAFFTHDVLLLLSVLRAPYIFHPRTETVAYHYEIFRFALKVEMNFIYVSPPSLYLSTLSYSNV